MRKQDSTSASLLIHTGKYMLKKRIVSSSLRRGSQEVTPPFVVHELFAVPLFNGVRRISQHNIKLPQSTAIHEAWFLKRVSINDGEILHTIEVQIHASNRAGEGIDFLTKHLHALPRLALLTQEVKTLHEHSTRTTCRVVDTLIRLWLQNLSHQSNNSAVGVELLGRITSIIGKLTYQVLVCLSHLVGRT